MSTIFGKKVRFFLIKNAQDARCHFEISGKTNSKKVEMLSEEELAFCKVVKQELLNTYNGQKECHVDIFKNLDGDLIYNVLKCTNSNYFWNLDSNSTKQETLEELKSNLAKSDKSIDALYTGIKCDNKDCAWADWSVLQKDYINWIDKPCPCCGSNLLTRKDFDEVENTMKKLNKLNKLLSSPLFSCFTKGKLNNDFVAYTQMDDRIEIDNVITSDKEA